MLSNNKELFAYVLTPRIISSLILSPKQPRTLAGFPVLVSHIIILIESEKFRPYDSIFFNKFTRTVKEFPEKEYQMYPPAIPIL